MKPATLAMVCLLVLSQAAGAQLAAADSTPLRPGDLIEVQAWRDTVLNGRYQVDERGRVLLPLVGEWSAGRTPWPVLRDSLLQAYARELRAGELRLVPRRRVFVLGFVGEPGLYFAEPTQPLAAVVALAGGPSPEGDLRRIRVTREGRTLFEARALDAPEMLGPVQSGDHIFVDRRGWFDRNAPFFVSALVSLAGIVVTLLIAR